MVKNKGISLIVLVITIVIIIILSGSILLSISNNNPVKQASEAKFKTNAEQYNSELTLATTSKYILDKSFDPNTFDAGPWDGTSDSTGTIKEFIPSITKDDASKYAIQDSKLVYVGEDDTERNWFGETVINTKVLFREDFQTAAYKNARTTADWNMGSLNSSTNEVLTKIKNLGTTGYDYFNSVINDNDGGYIAVGEFNDQFAIVKFDANLNIVNQKVFGGSGSDGYDDVLVDSDGNYVAFGSSNGDLSSIGGTTNKGSWDFVVTKFDRSFNILKFSHVGKDKQDSFIGCIEDKDGNYVASGISESNWSTTGGNTNKGDWDAAVVKYDRNLNFLGIQTIGGTSWERFWDIKLAANGDYIVIGDSNSNLIEYSAYGATANKGYTDGTVAKFSKNLDLLQMKTIGGSDSEFLFAITIDNAGNYVIGGSSASDLSALGGYVPSDSLDYLVFKMDPNLNLLKLRTLGGTNANYIMSLYTDSDNNYVFAGQSFSENNNMISPLVPSGEGSLVFGKLDSNLNSLFLNRYGSIGDIDFFYQVVQGSNGNYVAVGANQFSKTSVGAGAVNGDVDANIVEFGHDIYDSTKNVIESNAITLPNSMDMIRINLTASNTTFNNYSFYVSTNGTDWVNVPNGQLDGLTNIKLANATTTLYYKIKLIGFGSYTPQIYAVEFYDTDITKATTVIYGNENITYQYESATTQLSGSQSDEDMFTLPIGFNVKFGDKVYDKLYVSTNGVISTNNKYVSYECQSLYNDAYSQFICPYWTDLIIDKNTSANSGIYYKSGTEGARKYILIEYRDVYIYGNKAAGKEGNFEVKIFEDGVINMYYKNVDFYNATLCNGANATVGVNTESAGISQYLYKTKKLSQNTGIMFSAK